MNATRRPSPRSLTNQRFVSRANAEYRVAVVPPPKPLLPRAGLLFKAVGLLFAAFALVLVARGGPTLSLWTYGLLSLVCVGVGRALRGAW